MSKIFAFLLVLMIAAVAQASEPVQVPAGPLSSHFDVMPPPAYPQVAQTWHRAGKGWFELTVNPSNGNVTQVKIVKSTGVKVLDDAAAASFFHWHAKSGSFSRAVVPAEFRMPSLVHTH